MRVSSDLTGPERRSLRQALLHAAPSRAALTRLVYYSLDERLELIAGGDDLAEVVLHLIRWAEANERLDDLLRAAQLAFPENSKLRAIVRQRRQSAPPALADTPTAVNADEDDPVPHIPPVASYRVKARLSEVRRAAPAVFPEDLDNEAL
jgi:hypothetical protein